MELKEEIKRSGIVAVIGKPNVGKSTLINRLLGQKVMAVSFKPQTTRKRQLGILTDGNFQIIFVDTPGFHIPKDRLGMYLNEIAEKSLEGIDMVLWIVDISQYPREEEKRIAQTLEKLEERVPVILALNKTDLLTEDQWTERREAYLSLFPNSEPIYISATTGYGLSDLTELIKVHLPKRPFEFPEDQLTDFRERDIAEEFIREAILFYLHEEVPYACAVRVEEFLEKGEDTAYILATIFVERESQKGIVIGEKGSMIKKIGIMARKEIEALLNKKIFLELRVKVLKNWRSKREYIKRFYS